MPSFFSADALAGHRVLITGGGTGLGRGLAEAARAHGAEVHIWGRRREVLETTAREIGAHAQVVDIRDPAQVDAAVAELWAAHGPLTGLVNNAGANFIAPTAALSPNGFRAITSTIMDGSFHVTHAVGRRWIEQELGGSVVSNLTTWVWTGSAFVTAAAMAKTAVHAMTMSLAVEWGRYGIRLNAVAPGPIPTEYAWEMLNPTEQSSEGATQIEDIPMGRFGRMDELAHLVLLLLSDACPYLTGATIPMDGGQHLAAPSTFARLSKMSDEDWAQARERGRAASEASKAQRSV